MFETIDDKSFWKRTKEDWDEGNYENLEGLVPAILFIVFIGGFLLLAPYLFSNPQKAREVLEENGYTQVEITGYRFWTCGDDIESTGFRAVTPFGNKVSGAVCEGPMTAAHIRFD